MFCRSLAACGSFFIVHSLALSKAHQLLEGVLYSKGVNSRLAIGTYIGVLGLKRPDILLHPAD